jgi:hypothetical protein
MSKIFRMFRDLSTTPLPESEDALHRRIRELEGENETLREKLAYLVDVLNLSNEPSS